MFFPLRFALVLLFSFFFARCGVSGDEQLWPRKQRDHQKHLGFLELSFWMGGIFSQIATQIPVMWKTIIHV